MSEELVTVNRECFIDLRRIVSAIIRESETVADENCRKALVTLAGAASDWADEALMSVEKASHNSENLLSTSNGIG